MRFPTVLLFGLLAAAPVASVFAAGSAKAPVVKDDDEEGKIEGIAIDRGDGRWLGLVVDGATFKLSFYNAKKKPEAPDVARVAARWNDPHKIGDRRAMLNQVGDAMVSPSVVRPPLTFTVFLTLISAEGTEVENHAVRLQSTARAPEQG